MEFTNGKNRFTNYELFDISVDFPRGRTIDNLQFSIGGMCSSKLDDIPRQYKVFKHQFKQLLYRRSKDGYYSKNFHFIPKISEVYQKHGDGLVYMDVFLFLEEKYDKQFVIDYLITLFDDFDQFYKSNKFFKFRKYAKKQSSGRKKSS